MREQSVKETCNALIRRAGLLVALVAILALAVSFCANRAWAQVLYGSVTGNVTDQSGAVVPSASVEILNTGTGTVTRLKTDSGGTYLANNLLPGTYRVTITASGFGKTVRDGIPVRANEVARADVTLAVSGATTTVEVSGQAAQLETDRADIHTDITSTALENLPFTSSETRNFQSLYKTIPGFSTPMEPNSAAGNPQRSMDANVNGMFNYNNVTRVDGVADMYPWLPQNIAYVPSSDSIQSVNVVTNNYDAEQGLAGGAAINVVTKSGTNDLHGGAFWRHNDQNMRARNYYRPRHCAPGQVPCFANPINPKNILNDFDADLGGPIKKNKLFFFGNWERTTQRQFAQSTQMIVPSALRPDASGNIDLTGAVAGNGDPVLIFDPTTGNAYGQDRTAFANNVIPASRVNPAFVQYLKRLPAAQNNWSITSPTVPGGDYVNTADAHYTVNEYDSKANWVPNDKTTVFGRYSISTCDILDPPALGTGGGNATNGGQAGDALCRIQAAGVGGTYTFTPTLAMDGNFGYTRQRLGAQNIDQTTNFGLQWGIPNTNWQGNPPTIANSALQGGMPAFTFPGTWSSLGDPQVANPFKFRDNIYVGAVNLTWMHGPHSFRFGFERVHWGLNHFQPQGGATQGPRGIFQFSGNMTSLNVTTGAVGDAPGTQELCPANTVCGGTIYNYWADFALGLSSFTGKSTPYFNPNSERESDWGAYFRDSWQITRKLTADLGVRWEYYPFITKDHEGIPLFNPNDGYLYVGGYAGIPKNDGVDAGHGNFDPRLGVAYRLTENTVLRGGFGMTVDPNSWRNLRDVYPATSLAADSGVVTGFGNNYSPAAVLSDPSCPVGSGSAPLSCSVSVGPWNGSSPSTPTVPVGITLPAFVNLTVGKIYLPGQPNGLSGLSTNTTPFKYNRGYIESWNVAVQQQVSAGFNWQVAYVGTNAVNNMCLGALNAAPLIPGAGGPKTQVLNVKYGVNWGFIGSYEPICWSNYEGLQTQLQHKVGGFGFIGAAYSFSRAEDNADGNDSALTWQYPAYESRNAGLSGFDQKHNFELFGVQPSPFGQGQYWLKSGWSAKILGGWQVSEVLTDVSGTPFTVGASNNLNSPGNAQTANFVQANALLIYGNHAPVSPTGVGSTCAAGNISCHYFNPLAFGYPGSSAFGTAPRNFLFGPGEFNLDLSIARTFDLTERVKFQLRGDAFSATNTPHFGGPSATCAGNGNAPAACTNDFGVVGGTLGVGAFGGSSITDGARSIWGAARLTF